MTEAVAEGRMGRKMPEESCKRVGVGNTLDGEPVGRWSPLPRNLDIEGEVVHHKRV